MRKLLDGVTARLADVLGRPLAPRDAPGPADAVVVLGAPLRPDGTPTPVVEERVRVGVELWRRGLAPVVCFTGGRAPGARHRRPEAEAMAARARELGLVAEAVRVEAGSSTTFENAQRTAALLRAEGRRRVWVVTQPFHLRRARHWMRRAGLEPLAWHIDDSLQYSDGWSALRWILTEYAAWVRLVGIDVLQAVGLRRRA